MAGVTFIASTGTASLVSASKAIRRRVPFVLLNPNKAVAEVIDAAGLAGFFENATWRRWLKPIMHGEAAPARSEIRWRRAQGNHRQAGDVVGLGCAGRTR